MRRALLVLLLAACSKREQAKPAPETKPSAAPAIEYTLEALTCRDGVLGVVAAPPARSAAPAASTAPAPAASSEAPSPSAAPTPGGAWSSGIGLGTVGSFGHAPGGTGVAFGAPRHPMRTPIVAVPTDSRGARAHAVAMGACGAKAELLRCHQRHGAPVGALELALTIDGGKITATQRVGGELDGEPLAACVASALGERTFDAAASGTTRYKITFEPPRPFDPPKIKDATPTVGAGLPPEVVRRIVRANFSRFRFCYEKALAADPRLDGTLTISFAIESSGAPTVATIASGTIVDPTMRACVAKMFGALSFPEPTSAPVSVSYPLEFHPAT